MAELHHRRDDTTPFVIQNGERAPFIICGHLGVMKLKSKILKGIPLDVRYVTLTIPPPFLPGSFLWVWHSLNGIEQPEFPSTAAEAVYIWRYLQLFGIDPDSEIVFRYLQELNRVATTSESPNSELSSIMTDMLEKIPKKTIPPPSRGRPTPASLSLEANFKQIRETLTRGEDSEWEPPRIMIPPRSMDDIPPLFESNGIDRLYLSLNPSEEIPPSMKGILTKKAESGYIVLGLGTPNVRIWNGRAPMPDRSYAIDLDNADIRMLVDFNVAGSWDVDLITRYGTLVDMGIYRGKIAVYAKTPEGKDILERDYYSRYVLSYWSYPVGKTTYYVGRSRIPVQGNIITLSSRSPIISSYYGDYQESSPGSGRREILQEEEIEINAFLYLWAYLNGQDNIQIFNPDSSVAIWYYIRYFGIPMDTRFVDLYFTQIVSLLELDILLPFLDGIPKTIRNSIHTFRAGEGKLSHINTILSNRGVPMEEERNRR